MDDSALYLSADCLSLTATTIMLDHDLPFNVTSRECGYATPFYYSCNSQLIQDIPDHYVTLAAPVIAYWTLCLFFHWLDMSDWKWLEKYRIHESVEVTSKNRVTRTQVVWAVIFQHILQTALGYVVLSDEHQSMLDHPARVATISSYIQPLLGETLAASLAYFVYWWAIPTVQLGVAMCVLLLSS